ncbi:MAG TPA: hypothetical protein VLH10_21310 [Yinghuangia sp.]|nr:hypothetical protein [Yinghuangia sp.]
MDDDITGVTEAALHTARALVLHDLSACGAASAVVVSVVEDAVAGRRWWVREWPDGAAYAPGLVAQDVQEALEERGTRWPPCPRHHGTGDDHQLYIEPELGPDPAWVCEKDAVAVAPLGELDPAR